MLPEGIEEWLKADYYGKPYSQETLADVQLSLHVSPVFIHVLHQISIVTATTMFGK